MMDNSYKFIKKMVFDLLILQSSQMVPLNPHRRLSVFSLKVILPFVINYVCKDVLGE